MFELFINFLTEILNFEIMDIPLYIYLITVTTVIVAIEVIKNFATARSGK